ncbi:MAG: lysylphosphatidylglycerol synthase domain-containing protein [Nocardioides sp.]
MLVRLGLPVAALAAVLARVGAEPFARALGLVTLPALAAALGVTALTTACSAGRWVWIVARRLGLALGLRDAVPAYYRSQLLNQVLPTGVLGDVHRALRHGGGQQAVGRAARAVAWERVLGQVGLAALAGLALVLAPTRLPAGSGRAALLVALGLGAGLALLAGVGRGGAAPPRRRRVGGGGRPPAAGRSGGARAARAVRPRGGRPPAGAPGRGAQRRRAPAAGARPRRCWCWCCSRRHCRTSPAGVPARAPPPGCSARQAWASRPA